MGIVTTSSETAFSHSPEVVYDFVTNPGNWTKTYPHSTHIDGLPNTLPLSDRRIFANGLDGPPDGITLDAEGGVWASMTLANQFERIVSGGAITDRIDMGDRTAIACTLGGPERRTLFLLSSTDAYPQRLVGTKLSRLDAVTVDVPGAGLP